MICQACGKNTATTHIKTALNGKLTEIYLCPDCAREQGYAHLFEGWGFGSLMSGLMGTVPSQRQVQRCPSCGQSFDEISRTGKIGCAACYKAFRSQLLPIIQRVHGTTQHKGKAPGGSALQVVDPRQKLVAVETSPIDEKKRLLQKAIEAQDFEQAAILRDEIKELQKNQPERGDHHEMV